MEPLNAARAADVTAEQLGASRWQGQAFRSAVFSYVLRWSVTERVAIDAVWARGHRREKAAVDADEHLDLDDRPTGEGGREGDDSDAAHSLRPGDSPAGDPAPA